MTDRIVFENNTVVVLVREKAAPPAPPGPDPTPPEPWTPPLAESPLYDLVNYHRRVEVAANPLERDPNAERIAQGWAEEMARTGDFHHNPGLAADLADPWYSVAENIAWTTGTSSTEDVVHQLWLDSPPHRRNIEGSTFTHLGVGRAAGAGGRTYWVEVFVDRLA